MWDVCISADLARHLSTNPAPALRHLDLHAVCLTSECSQFGDIDLFHKSRVLYLEFGVSFVLLLLYSFMTAID